MNGAVDTNWYANPYSDYYSKGIFGPNNLLAQSGAEGEEINHASVLIGWGEDEKGKKYWLLRNSYGATFGQNGVMQIERGTNAF